MKNGPSQNERRDLACSEPNFIEQARSSNVNENQAEFVKDSEICGPAWST
jgi:hypothetical protein